MVVLFSDNYHVSDSTDWCSSSCPSLVARRTAKRRGTERTKHRRRSGWFAESGGRLSYRVILVANVYERDIPVPSVGSLALLQSSSDAGQIDSTGVVIVVVVTTGEWRRRIIQAANYAIA
jgi:hypothetical protein